MAAGRRVLVSGMGGDLGSRVAVALEQEPWVGELVGIDVDPPRRRLHRAEFHLIAPVDHDRIVETITAFNPHAVIDIYGRARGAPTRPDESAEVDPTCEYGEMLAGIEHTANAIGARIGVSVG